MAVNDRELLISGRATGCDSLVDKILDESTEEYSLYLKAKELKRSAIKRIYVESCLLASQDFKRISELLEIPEPLIKMYSDVFYSIEGLDKLSKMELLAVENKDEASLKIWALNQGLDFISWRLGSKVNVNPMEGLSDMFTTCIYKAKEAAFSANESASSIESTKWTKLAMDMARLLRAYSMDTDQAKRDIGIALKEVIPDFKGFDELDDPSQS